MHTVTTRLDLTRVDVKLDIFHLTGCAVVSKTYLLTILYSVGGATVGTCVYKPRI